ncbi:hypothetical protein WR25_09485 [Diploscapter pachys]|uniref:Uncharacterized protein n=1 Tax=Diploscapter pachys TaxID=2018661 RepID=A0A2A2LN27_9BILA|nr:hypothetical protein WR25_09485 [Diploscapter pachys]
MDAVQQQQANRIAQLKEKIALAARQLNKLREDNERDAFKIQHMDKQCELLHEDLRHLAESRGTFEGIFLDTQILRNIGKPMQVATLEQKIISVDARICLQKLENERKKHNDNTHNRHSCGAEGNKLNEKQKQKKGKGKVDVFMSVWVLRPPCGVNVADLGITVTAAAM